MIKRTGRPKKGVGIDELAAMIQRGFTDVRSEVAEVREVADDTRAKVVEFIELSSANRRRLEDQERRLEHMERRVSALERQKKM